MGKITHGELFAGIGGFSLGFERAGIDTLWRVEIDSRCQKVLKAHYPGGLLLSDVRECGQHNLPPVDIITFGSPCQNLSLSGKREGINGEQSRLYFEAVRIVGELQPAFAVWENVPGALSSNDGRDFASALGALRECGARDLAWRSLDASGFNLAQRRVRLFLVGDLAGERAAQILFESEGMPRDDPAGREEGDFPPPDIETSSGIRGGDTIEFFECDRVAPTLNTRSGDQAGQGLENISIPVKVNGEWKVRKLAPVEFERLFGYPDDWTAGLCDSDRYHILGNSVAVNVTQWLGYRIMTTLKVDHIP